MTCSLLLHTYEKTSEVEEDPCQVSFFLHARQPTVREFSIMHSRDPNEAIS